MGRLGNRTGGRHLTGEGRRRTGAMMTDGHHQGVDTAAECTECSCVAQACPKLTGARLWCWWLVQPNQILKCQVSISAILLGLEVWLQLCGTTSCHPEHSTDFSVSTSLRDDQQSRLSGPVTDVENGKHIMQTYIWYMQWYMV